MKNNTIQKTVKNLPQSAGIYKFIDKNDKIIYIGKAKNIKKRAYSYFTKSKNKNNKIRVLVSNINQIKYTVVENESDALLLENNLIKEHQPKYNVQLKDDKTFPWICIKDERFPRVFLTRNRTNDNSVYYGPYTSVKMVKAILDFIRRIYKTRTCNYNLSEQNITNKKFKACLEYHIGNCKAPCIGLQSQEEYDEGIKNIQHILKGNLNKVIEHLHALMEKFSSEYRYEEANEIKEKIKLINKFKSKSTIVNPAIHNADVFSIVEDKKKAYVNYLKVINGAIIQTHLLEMKKKLDEEIHELLTLAVTNIREKLHSDSNEIILPFSVQDGFKGSKITVPIRGDKKRLLDLAERNAKQFLLEKHRQEQQSHFNKREKRIMNTLQKDLQLKELPDHIECFDNSNIMGENPVSSCVVFRNGKPSKSEYRHFNIKTVKGPDDFASMEEVIFRRYKRSKDEGKEIPKLVIIDGGKGQLNAARKSLAKLELKNKISIIGIAKQLEKIYFPGDSVPIYLDKKSESLKLIQNIRNEAHRFSISFHRNKRSKIFTTSEIDKIKGIGEKSKQLLFEKYKTLSAIRNASMEDITGVIGKLKAKKVVDYFVKEK